ncbi:MAG: hypothetical protein ACE5NG_15510 [bacterium]
MAKKKKNISDFIDTKKEINEIRLQGRGGQGIVTAGELLGRAAILEGTEQSC